MDESRVQRDIDFHLERACDLECYANHWWRISKYAWLHAAAIHRTAARELASILSEMRQTRAVRVTGLK